MKNQQTIPPQPNHLERQICLLLDGELPADEQVELTRELLRNPTARQLHDEYAELDEQAAGAMQWLLEQPARPTCDLPRKCRIDWAGKVTSGWAVAAAVLLMVAIWTVVELTAKPQSHSAPVTGGLAVGGGGSIGSREAVAIDMEFGWYEAAASVQTADYQEPRPLIETPAHQQRQTHRRSLGIYDEENERLYLLELERQITERQALGEEL